MSILKAERLFVPGGAAPPGTIDLGLGYPDLSAFPDELIDLGVFADPARRAAALSYGPPAGSERLITALRSTLIRDEPSFGAALITNGSIEAIDLILRVLAKRGDVILSEDPTFPGLLPAAANVGLEVLGVPTDDRGLDPDLVEDAVGRVARSGRRVAALFLMPSGANPTGSRMPDERRQKMAELAGQLGLMLVEDDAYRHIEFEGANPPTIHSYIPGNVVNIRSLSKLVCPGVRLAITVGPSDMVDEMLRYKPVGGTTPFGSEIVGDLLERIDYDRYVAGLCALYRGRRDAAVSAVQAHLAGASFRSPPGGFFLWVTLPLGVDADALHAVGLDHGVRVLPGRAFSVQAPQANRVRISYSFEPAARVERGLQLLAEAVGMV